MHSKRFQRTIHITRHAQQRMAGRDMDEALLLELIDTGTVKMKDAEHGWAFKSIAGRDDNPLCAAFQLGATLVVKTVMHYFSET